MNTIFIVKYSLYKKYSFNIININGEKIKKKCVLVFKGNK